MADYQEDFDLNIPALPALTEQAFEKGIQIFVNAIPGLPTLTEEAATVETPDADPDIVWLYGDGGYTDLTSEATDDTPDNVPLCGPVSPVSGDIIYVGSANEFYAIGFDVSTAGVGNYTLDDANYWNGVGWAALNESKGELGNFKTVDLVRLAADLPPDWAKNSVNASALYHYLRVRYTGGVGGTFSTRPLGKRIKIKKGSVAWTLDVSDTLVMSDAVSHGMGLVVSDSLSLSDAVSFYQTFAGGRVRLPISEVAGRMPGRNVTYSGNALDAYPAMTQFPNLEQSAAILIQTWGNALTFKLSPDGVNYQDEEEVDPDKNLGSWFHRGSARGITVKNKTAGLVARYQIVVFFV